MAAPLALVIFCYVAVIHFYRRCIPILSKKISQQLKTVSKIEIEKREALQLLQDQQSSISMKDEFAKYAKLERKITKLKEELKSLKNSQVATRFTISWGISLALNAIYTVGILWLVWTYRYEPVILLPEEWCWPLGRLLSFPCGIPGSVGITVWLGACSVVIGRIQGSVSKIMSYRKATTAS
ncbi:guided entry of tail-anchored proteins factor 1-like [Diadema setosum]|uniref:guided entry of tail-anchored proteins factor 1-like n=1 Tax=Diadema setosum TaxID=31175 RepID=UPI003B39FD6F